MGLVSTSIPNMLNGISQQPPEMRMPSQGEEQVNCLPSLVDGLKKRPPTEFVKELAANTFTDVKVHNISRDVTEKYIVLSANSYLWVYDLDGQAKQVDFPNNSDDYLLTATPSTSIRMLSIADYTFVVNVEKTIEMKNTTSAGTGVEGLVYVKQGNYAQDYIIVVNGVQVASYTTLRGNNTDDVDTLQTNWIAQQLETDLLTSLSSADWDIRREASTIHIKKKDGSDFELKTEDSFNGNALKSVKGVIRRFEDLPTVAPEDFIVEIAGEIGSEQDNYYVKFVTENASDDFGSGYWEETIKPGIQYMFDETTMPHVLIRNSNGTFTFEPASWGTRTVGDENTVPDPSFVGRGVNDLFLFRNRLCFLSSDAITTSRSGEFFELFPTTITTILDSGPIDVSANHTKVSNLRHAVEIEQQMIIFSDETQFVFTSDGTLTPESASLRVSTEFEASLKAKPIGVGRRIYFAVEHGDYSGIREFYVDPSTESKDAADITAHVPKYIPKSVSSIVASPNKDMLVIVSEEDRSKLWVYNFYWKGNEKLQSSWGFWDSSHGEILDVIFFGTSLYVIVQGAGEVTLSRMETEQGYTDENNTYLTHIDRRVDEGAVIAAYNAGNNRTTFTLPYDSSEDTYAVTRADGGTTIPGQVLNALEYSGNTIQVQGDWTGKSFYVGDTYTHRHQFSQQVMRDSDGSAISAGRLQLLNWLVKFSATGYFKAVVTPLGRAAHEYVYTGNNLGDGITTIGAVKIANGFKRFPIRSRNDRVTVELVNDTFQPSSFTAAEWEANYTIRSRRI